MTIRPLTPSEFSELMDEDVIDPEISTMEAKQHYQLLYVHYQSVQQELKDQNLELLETKVDYENERNMRVFLQDDCEPKTPELPKEDAAMQEILNSLQIENVQQKKTIDKLELCCEEMTLGYLAMMDERQKDSVKISKLEAIGKRHMENVLEIAKENSELESELAKAQHRITEQMVVIENLRREKEDQVERQEAFAVARAERDRRREQVRERDVDIDLAEASERGEKRLRRSLLKELEEEYVPEPENRRGPSRRINIREYQRNPRRTQQELLEEQTKRFQQFKK